MVDVTKEDIGKSQKEVLTQQRLKHEGCIICPAALRSQKEVLTQQRLKHIVKVNVIDRGMVRKKF